MRLCSNMAKNSKTIVAVRPGVRIVPQLSLPHAKIPTVRQTLAPPTPISAPSHGTNLYRS
jgi:hypothetical protein